MRGRQKNQPSREIVELGDHSGGLRLVAFSDYRSQDIGVLLSELSKVQPAPDLILYAGDDIARFRPHRNRNYFARIARIARHGLCAVAGNDDLPSARELISGKSIFNVHQRPVSVGGYAILGLDGAPLRKGTGIGYLLHPERAIAKHLRLQKLNSDSLQLIVLSHAPPEGILDQAVRFSVNGEARSIGSSALKNFIETNKEVVLVVCGHVHRCGGKHENHNGTTVINAANHDDDKAIARLALIELRPLRPPKIEWRLIRPVAMVPGIGPTSRERLERIGIRTVEELAVSALGDLQAVLPAGLSPGRLRSRAQAIVQGRPVLLRAPELPKGLEIYLDIETDLRQTYIWLIGLCVGQNGRYQSFFAKSPAEEKEILSKFAAFMRRYPDANILTCSGCRFEERVISKRLAAHGLSITICDKMLDLHPVICRCAALPTSSYGVKDMGGFFGYRYKHPGLNGFTIASYYDAYCRGRNQKQRRALAQKMIEYNRDDVRCLPFIVKAIETIFARENVEQVQDVLFD